jgi:PAS domain-containing protein
MVQSSLSLDEQLIHDLERMRLQIIGLEAAESAQREKAEDAASDRDELRRLLDALPIAVWRAGPDGVFLYWNRRCSRFIARSAAEGAPPPGWFSGVHPDDYPACLAAYSEAVQKRSSFTLEYRRKRNDDSFCPVRDYGGPLTDAAGRFTGFVGAFFELPAFDIQP